MPTYAVLLMWFGMLVVSAVFAVPTVTVILTLVTFGIGLLAIALFINATFYFSLALPGILLARWQKLNWVASWVAALFLPIGIGLTTGLPERATAAALAEAYQAEDVTGNVRAKSDVIVLREARVGRACSHLCERLLAGGYARSVVLADQSDRR